jgi:predicted signal transduction protein with EAL and GGDEF domain
MTTPQNTAAQVGGPAPVACRLTSAELAAQVGRWARLIARALAERSESADGVRLSFRPEPGTAEELRVLAAIENQCCPWAEWTVDTSAGAIVLDVRTSGAGLATLYGMFRSVSAP